jgi:hypothetical protein
LSALQKSNSTNGFAVEFVIKIVVVEEEEKKIGMMRFEPHDRPYKTDRFFECELYRTGNLCQRTDFDTGCDRRLSIRASYDRHLNIQTLSEKCGYRNRDFINSL